LVVGGGERDFFVGFEWRRRIEGQGPPAFGSIGWLVWLVGDRRR
jgi:hypothetical protein